MFQDVLTDTNMLIVILLCSGMLPSSPKSKRLLEIFQATYIENRGIIFEKSQKPPSRSGKGAQNNAYRNRGGMGAFPSLFQECLAVQENICFIGRPRQSLLHTPRGRRADNPRDRRFCLYSVRQCICPPARTVSRPRLTVSLCVVCWCCILPL